MWSLGLLIALSAAAAKHKVDPGAPLQEAVDRLQPGDQLVFGPGEYRDSFILRSSDVSLHGQGAIFSGLRDIEPNWQAAGKAFKTKVDHTVRQLFSGTDMLIPARWPKRKFSRGDAFFADMWDNGTWRAAALGAKYGVMVDPALAGQDFTGCVAILNIGAWQTFRRVITSHTGDRFTYSTAGNERLHHSKHPVGMDRYCIYGKACLDAPGEWYYDAAESALYVIPPPGTALADLDLRSKVIAEAVVLEGVRNVTLENFKFLGTTLRLTNCADCELVDLQLTAPSTVVDPFGPNPPHESKHGRWDARRWFGESSVDALVEVSGDRIVMRGLNVSLAEGPALTVIGDQPIIEDSHFWCNDWHGLDYGFGIDLLATTRPIVRRIELSWCGGSEGLRLPNHSPALVEHSHLHHCGLRQSDGAIIQTSTAGCKGTEIRFNRVHDHNAFHWGGNGIRGDDGARGLHVHHNVLWNCKEKGIVLKGDEHHVHHNVCFDNASIDILIPRNRLPSKLKELAEQNRNSRVYSNQGKVQGNWKWEPPAPPYCEVRNPLPAPEDQAIRDRLKSEGIRSRY
jgi:hypothetical protein